MTKSAPAPDAVRLVPVEPTEAMINAAVISPLTRVDWRQAVDTYAAMLAAAPAPATARGGDAGAALAVRFHDTYERLAPSFGYETRPDTKAFDPESPNGRLMIAVCSELSAALASQPQATGGAVERKYDTSDMKGWVTDTVDRYAREFKGARFSYEVTERLVEIFERTIRETNVLAALATQPAPSPGGWQDISTAPKVIEFRCLLAHPYSIVTGYWDGDGWRNDRSAAGHHFPATHWQPLPAAPSIQQGDEG